MDSSLGPAAKAGAVLHKFVAVALALSSLTVVMAPAVVTTGASLTAFTVMLTLWLLRVLTLGAVPEPLSITSKVTLPVPLALTTVLYWRPANSMAVTVVPAVTAVVPSALNRVMKAGMAVIL